MKFCCISDTHNQHEYIQNIPDCDMIIHTGDATGRGSIREITEFCEWYGELPHKHKILIAGNHDWGFQKSYRECKQICDDNGIIYLQDSGIEIEGIKIWGSPQTPEFYNWAFNCWRTEADEKRNDRFHGGYDWIGRYWKMIPKDTDLLLTHGPPHGIMDWAPSGGAVGCEELLKVVQDIKPKFHIFGHIHENRGEERHDETTFVNASSLDGRYRNRPDIIDVYTIGEDDE